MARSFTIKNSQVAVLITLMVFIFLGACYFFIYVPNNEKTVQERHFRCLQNIDNNIKSKIDNSLSQVRGLLNVNDIQRKVLYNYIKNYPKNNFTLTQIDTIHSGKGKAFHVEKSSLSINISSRKLIEYVSKPIANKKGDTTFVRMSISYGFNQFIKPLLPGENFDNYIVFYDGKVLYETFPSGLSYNRRDSILQSKNGMQSPGIKSMSIGGTDYKVFSQPVNVGDKEWIVVGLVTNKDYQKEKNQLPLGIVLLLLTIAVGIIILYPWIKLYHMGNKDKLTVTDGVSSVLISMLLMSLLFFFIFKYSFYFSSSYKHLVSSRDTLPNQMIKAFESDIYKANRLLSKYDTIHNRFNKNIINLGKKNAKYETVANTLSYAVLENVQNDPENVVLKNDLDSLKRALFNTIIVHQVYWLDTTGTEEDNWIADSINAPHTNFKSRPYFMNTNAPYPKRTGPNDFYLDQLISRTSGDFTTVIAKNSKYKQTSVAAMSFTPKSLDSVIMPDGYQFAVIDSTGEVLYHSIKDRNLNENLKTEFADSSELVSALEAKSDTNFVGEYYGRQYRTKIKPFPHLPYFIVIFEDVAYNDARDTESYSFTISMLVCLLIFLIIQFGVVFFVSSKRSFFKRQLFDTSWIGPKINSQRQYNLAIIANVTIIILLIIFFDLSSFLKYLYIILFSITFISIFLNSVFAIHYKEIKRPDNRDFKLIAVGWLCAFVVIIDLSAFFTLETGRYLGLLGYEALLTAVCAVAYYFGQAILLKFQEYKVTYPELQQYWSYTHSFALMTTTRLVITSGIPIAFFFIYSFNYEQNLDTRYRQLNFAKALAQRPCAASNIDTGVKGVKNCLAQISGVYYDGVSIKALEADSKINIPNYSNEDSIMVKVFSSLRLINNNLELKSNNINYASVNGQAFFKNRITYERPKLNSTTITDYKFAPDKFIKLSSGQIDYPALTFQFWVLLTILVVIFYYVIHNVIRKLFALSLPPVLSWETIDEKLLLDNKLNSMLFVLGSPGSEKLKKLKHKLSKNMLTDLQEKELLQLTENDQIKERNKKLLEYSEGKLLGKKGEILVYKENDLDGSNVFIADMIHISTAEGENNADWKACKEEAFKSKNALIIINHFEYNIKDPKANSIKLDFLESLMIRDTSKIMIISTVHPLTFLDSFNEQQADNYPETPQASAIPESELERWHVLLGHFRIIIKPITVMPKYDDGQLSTLSKGDQFERAIFEETRHSHYLNDMRKMAGYITPGEADDFRDVVDSLIFKLQITSHYFYTYIWQSLTKEEKFLLYDLAEDGLVNPYDDYNLSMLISKGLIVKTNGTLMLFNKGFRNYILTAIGNTELKRIKDQVKDNGNWGSLKTPLVIAILAILVFLIASQQEAYRQIITYITALGAGVPAVLKIFSLFPNNTQKTQ